MIEPSWNGRNVNYRDNSLESVVAASIKEITVSAATTTIGAAGAARGPGRAVKRSTTSTSTTRAMSGVKFYASAASRRSNRIARAVVRLPAATTRAMRPRSRQWGYPRDPSHAAGRAVLAGSTSSTIPHSARISGLTCGPDAATTSGRIASATTTATTTICPSRGAG